ncbi:MAG: hypothetical protein Q9166_000071 [cf. Caloplaca sp. 2 TL-2023]
MPRADSHSNGKKNGAILSKGLLGSRSYAADYIGFALLLTGYIFVCSHRPKHNQECNPLTRTLQILTIAEPFHRMFSLDNIALQFPHAEIERVPETSLTIYLGYNILFSALTPFLILLVTTVLLHPSPTPNRSHKPHVTILGLLISLILTSFITDVIKNAVGRPRPDLLARCKPAKGTPPHKLVTVSVCTEKDHHVLHDGWRSFPSGHSSFAFSGLGYLSLYVICHNPSWSSRIEETFKVLILMKNRFLAGQFHIFLPRTDLFRVLLALSPLIGAALIAISRCEDYRHDVYDVTVGSILGISIAYFSYRRYYPSLKSRRCDTPYSSRAEAGAAEGRMGKRKDEEEMVGLVDAEDGEGSEHVPLQEASRESGRRGSAPD